MTVNPLHGNISQIYMMAVLRYADKSIVSTLSKNQEITKEGIRECVAGNAASIQPGKRYTSQGDTQSIHYTLDAQGRVYAIVTNRDYSPRVAFTALDELQQTFAKEFGLKVASATEESLTRSSRPLMSSIFEKYAQPANVDKLASVQEKVDVVKTVMQENIQQILQNNECLERIEAQAEHLNEQSLAFKKGAKEMNEMMWWKMWKMRILFGGLIVLVLIIIIVPTAVVAQKH